MDAVTPLQLFEWAVVRQSDLGPGVQTAAAAFGVTAKEVRALVLAWDDPRWHMSLARFPGGFGYRIEAYYNTSG